MSKVGVLVILTAVALLLLPGIATADEPSGCRFTGTVKLDGADVADGTTITATIAGDEYGNATPTGWEASTYSVAIQPPQGTYYADGTKVTFKINGHTTYQTGTFQAGENIRLDLTVSTRTTPAPTSTPSATPTPTTSPTTSTPTPNSSPEPGSPTNVWLIVGLVIACIAEASVVGGVAFIVFSNWNR